MTHMEDFVRAPKPLGDDVLAQLMVNERYDMYAITKAGRVFKKRAKGHSGSYDRWQEIDVMGEINEDLFS